MRSVFGIGLALIALACGCGADAQREGGACVDGDARCGQTCNSRMVCPQGLYCGTDGRCAKDCIAPSKSTAKDTCSGAAECTAFGKCVKPDDDQQGGVQIPGGHLPMNGSGGNGGSGGTPAFDAGSVCPRTVVRGTRVMPTVILIIDQSGSMTDEFGSSTRWTVLRDFLLEEPAGLLADLQKQVRFGFALYSGFSMDQPPERSSMECPVVTTVGPAFDNFDAIADVYRMSEPLDDTPTGDSIDKVVEVFGLDQADPEESNPVVFVLATDGEPDRCEELDPQTDLAKQESIDAVTRAFNLGIRTYVISVGDEVSEQHQQDIANAGLGNMAGDPNAEYWTAGDDASLRTALTSIVNSQLSCKIALNGTVADGEECKGTVTLNGADLECNGAEGWRLVDPKHVELVGDACTELKASDALELEITFPCDFRVD